MAVVSPSVTAATPLEFSEQIEKLAGFVKRLHVDVADGVFAPRTVSIAQCWWPVGVTADFHVMYQQPWRQWESIISHRPHLVIVHAEADLEDFVAKTAELHQLGISVGLALLKDTRVQDVSPEFLKLVDHALIFSGNLGHFGGEADLGLINKVAELKSISPRLEIGWDGGVNAKNAAWLADGGVDVLTSGGFIQHAKDPMRAYLELAHRIV